ncbi:MBL fold metallo-hydrolase [Sphingomonas beigongshangi]|uniref:MBL fold metallo-hydrolase n=1 Tax=Sphingomonas beigongshangi TaxID=2782540 RepID=UPI001AED88DF|nr:MBL fold metallo-hydrolase [Sphingomonas beigongshangi]
MTILEELRVGRFTVTTLLDGHFPAGVDLITGAGSSEGEALFVAAGLPPIGPSHEPINAFAIKRDGEVWLLDVGFGAEFVPGFGGVRSALEASGHKPADIRTIVLTHLHPDHIGGLIEQGGRAYPNARLIVPQVELDFWSDPAATAASREPEANVRLAGEVLRIYESTIIAIDGSAPFAPGLRFWPLPGHTPGHSGVMIEDEGDTLLMWADTIHSAMLQMPYPHWTVEFDDDPAVAAATRHELFADLALSGQRVIGSHIAGCGRIERRGNGYALIGPSLVDEAVEA